MSHITYITYNSTNGSVTMWDIETYWKHDWNVYIIIMFNIKHTLKTHQIQVTIVHYLYKN